jgi:hypothetical protein
MTKMYLQVQWLIAMLDAARFLAPLQGGVQQKNNACSYIETCHRGREDFNTTASRGHNK